MPNSKGRVKYFIVEIWDYKDIKNNVFKEYLMTQKNDLAVILRKICNMQTSTYNPIPIMPKKDACTHANRNRKMKRRKHINILPVTFFEWVGLWMIEIFFLHIWLDFPNCYNYFPNQATKQRSGSKVIPFSASQWQCLCIRSFHELHPA